MLILINMARDFTAETYAALKRMRKAREELAEAIRATMTLGDQVIRDRAARAAFNTVS